MPYKIKLKELKNLISKIHFANEGDSYERNYWIFFKERFPNCEIFWQHFIVPCTKRIEPTSSERIRFRDGISEKLIDISSFHYSMFLNLIYSYNHLENFGLSSFEDFYIHLGSACDLAEEFLSKIYLLILECNKEKNHILEQLTKDEFLKLAEEWYDNNYKKLYEHYFKKGKFLPIKIPQRKNLLDEYFNNLNDWKEYKIYIQKIREYRNTIIHDVQIGRIIPIKGGSLVPRKEKISNYKKWSQVFAVQKDIQKLKGDFINMKEQMIIDIGTLEIHLNNLWEKVIEDVNNLFKNKNRTLLEHYNIDLI